jgi:hypothetical protein
MIKDKMIKLNNSIGQEELNKDFQIINDIVENKISLEQVIADEGKMNIVTKFI